MFDTVELTSGADGNADALLSQPKRFALLCFLAIPNPGTMYRRDTLLGLFWPEGDSEHTRTSLRQALAQIRKALGRDVILRRGSEEVGLNPDLLWCDVGAFEHALDDCKWSEAIELYRGDLLKGLFVSQAPEFERWLETERARLAGRYAGALEELANAATAAGKNRAAVEWWQSLVLHDPYDSRLATGLMEALERAGDPGNALLHAREHAELLREEFEIAPPAEFEASVQKIRVNSTIGEGAQGTSGRASRIENAVGESPTPAQAAPKPVWKSKAVGAGMVALMVAVVGVMVLLWKSRAEFDPESVVVAAFRNATGDPSLDQLGERAGHWITRGIQRAAIPVTPWDMALQSWRYVQTELEAGRVRDPVRIFAAEASAGIVVSGTVYLVGSDSLEVHTSVTDARRGRLIGMLDPVSGSRFSDSELLDDVKERVMAFLSIRFEKLFRDWVPDLTVEPPGFEAQQEYAEGCRQLLRGEDEAAILPLTRASQLDSTFVLPLHRLVSAYGNLGRYAQRDSIFQVLEGKGSWLTPFDRATVEARRLGAANDWEGALPAFQRAAELAPGSPEEVLYGYAAIMTNRPRLAVEVLSAIDPERGYSRQSFRYWLWMIDAQLMLGQFEDAVAAARRCRQLHPEDPRCLHKQSTALAALGRVEELHETQDELEAMPTAAGYQLVTVCDFLRYYGHTDAAKAEAGRAVRWLEAHPPSEARGIRHRQQYGRALFLAGRMDDAQRVYDAIVDDLPDNTFFRMRRAFVAAMRGDTATALSVADSLDRGADRWEGIQRDADRLFYRGVIYGALGDRERAWDLLNQFAQRWGWHYGDFNRVDVIYEPLKGYPPYEEMLRPKG